MGEKMQPHVGEDGRLYYNYGVGAKYVFREYGEEYTFEITDCCIRNTTEYYTCAKNGEPYWNKFTANRIHYLLHFNLLETVSEGERRKMPLTVDEVNTYYKRKTQERAEAIKSLGNTDYIAKSKKLQDIPIDIGLAEARGQTDRIEELTKQEAELRAKCAAILKAKKIEPATLRGVKFCKLCEGKGVIGMQVCECAKKLETEIQEYNAIMRRAKLAQATE